VLAIVRADDAIFTRGFGVVGIEKKTLQTRRTFSSAEAGAIAVTMTYSDCREVGVGLASDTFTLQPSTEWGRGK